jgi:hypothetical protein
MVTNITVNEDQLDPATSLAAEDYTPALERPSLEVIFLGELAAAEDLLKRIDADAAPDVLSAPASLRTCREAKQLRKTVQLMREFIQIKGLIPT